MTPYIDYKTRTRRRIQRAFLELLEERPFEKITVANIAERAEVSRPTFYAHFETKYFLLTSLVEDMLKAFFEQVSHEAENRVLKGESELIGGELALLTEWKRHERVIRLLGVETLEDSFNKVATREFAVITRALTPDYDWALFELYYAFWTAATFGFLKKWTEKGMPYDINVVANIMATLVGPQVLARVRAEYQWQLQGDARP